jgi:signal peptidase II
MFANFLRQACSWQAWPRQAWYWYSLALVVIVLDQLSKHWASSSLTYDQPVVITSFFNLTLRHNLGAAFSFLASEGGWQRWFFAAIALGASVLLLGWIARVCLSNRLEAFALSFILGGALGNLYDRILLGHVVDFIEVHYQDHYWPAFNLADSAITLGAIILLALMFLVREQKSDA